MSDSHELFRFGEEGELEPTEAEDEEKQLNDFGKEMPWYETKGGFRRDVMSSLFQKAVRRSDEERAAFAARELVRSGTGYETHFWNRALLVCIEDLVAGNGALEHVLRYEELAKNRWEDKPWRRRLCAIAAALVCARAQSGRETTHANGYFSNTMEDRARKAEDPDHEPLYEPPVTEDELDPNGRIGSTVVDKHVYTNPGRSWPHFRIHGARIGPESETDLGEKWWRRVLEYDHPDYAYRQPTEAYTKEQIEHALEPTPEDDPWRCDFDSEGSLDEFRVDMPC